MTRHAVNKLQRRYKYRMQVPTALQQLAESVRFFWHLFGQEKCRLTCSFSGHFSQMLSNHLIEPTSINLGFIESFRGQEWVKHHSHFSLESDHKHIV